jgi:hypothetical protein
VVGRRETFGEEVQTVETIAERSLAELRRTFHVSSSSSSYLQKKSSQPMRPKAVQEDDWNPLLIKILVVFILIFCVLHVFVLIFVSPA